jgi:CubicO group peptidase (beta-lactamase class C family)
LFLAVSHRPALAAGVPAVPAIPISIGTNRLAIPSLDDVMVGFVKKIGSTGGTLAISRGGRLLYERGYGWLDRQHKIPAPPNAFFGIASCEKPITAAAVRKLAAEGKLSLQSPLFSTLGIHPAGSIVDRRVTNITFEDVLEHKAGWGGDIGNELTGLARAAGGRPPFAIPVLLAQVMSRPLEDEPGHVYKYSNFGFDTMRYVVERESGITPGVYYREKLLQKSKCREIAQPQELTPDQQTNHAVWNLRAGGPVCASAKYLCAFMEEYWQTGKPRDRADDTWWMYGSLNGSTAIMVWRPDGINIAAVFNGRNDTTHDEIRTALEAAASRVFSESPFRFSTSSATNVPGRAGTGP